MKLKMSGVYKITNIKTGLAYIGQSKNIWKRWGQEVSHAFTPSADEYNSLLSQAIREYGIENFDAEVLCECPEDMLLECEKELILEHNTIHPFGYNKEVRDRKVMTQKFSMYDIDGNWQQDFEKIIDAADFLIEEGSMTESVRYTIGRDIGKACRGERQVVCGHRWSYAGQPIQLAETSSKKMVYLLNTHTLEIEQQFFSCGDAARFLGCTTSSLARHCRGQSYTCMKRILCYSTDYESRKEELRQWANKYLLHLK